MPDIIQLVNLSKAFPGGALAVDDITLSVGEGEFVTLLGPSGCGKTTTLRMIAGFEIPTDGRIFLAGEDVTERPPYQRQVNTVFQDYALFPHMNVKDNVGYGLRVAGVPKPEIGRLVGDALSMVGLLERAQDRPHQLSGGQKQRVALARAIVRKPKVLLLDEPLSALDAKLRGAMQVELKHLHEQLGITFVYVTHDQTEALVMSDRVVVMDQGRIAQSGAPTELYDHPATPYVANFIGSSNMIEGQAVKADRQGTLVRFSSGEILCRTSTTPISEGERVTLSVRPEKVSILENGKPPPEGFSVIQGVVRDSLFHGNSYRIELDIDQAELFIVDVQLRSLSKHAAMPPPGTKVALAIDPENVTTFAGGGVR